MTGHIYIGGYPNKHSYDDVINQGFEGCIDNLTLSGNQVNLTTNLAMSGVKPGCPTKVCIVNPCHNKLLILFLNHI